MLVNALPAFIHKISIFSGIFAVLPLKIRTIAKIMRVIRAKKVAVQDINIGAWIPGDLAGSALTVIAL